MNTPAPKPQYCDCKMQGTRWLSACKAHEAQYIKLAAMARTNYEAARRHAEMLAPREVTP